MVRLLASPDLRSGKKNQEEDAPDFAAEGADGIWEDGTDTEPVPEEEADAFSGSMDADTEDDLILSAQELGDDGEADGGGTAAKKKKRHKKRKKNPPHQNSPSHPKDTNKKNTKPTTPNNYKT